MIGKGIQQKIHIAVLEVVGRLLDLVLMIYIAVGKPLRPGEVEHVFHALQIHREPLQSISYLACNRLAIHAAHLLKIGELRNLHAVQPYFPAQAPGAKRRIFPIILDEANIVLLQIEAELFQRTEVQFQDIGGRRFQHDLKLIVMLQAVGVFAIAAILGAARGLHVGSSPGLGAKRAKKSGGMRSAGANFHVIRLQQRATLLAPIMLQGKNDFLKGEHNGSSAS